MAKKNDAGSPTEKTCFVVAPIGSDGSDIRRRSDQILRHIIQPELERRSYSVVRADMLAQPGIITGQIFEQLVHADLVIADLTGHNANVLYELAIRHALKKACIHIIAARETLPFDVAQNRAIFFNHQDLDSAAYCREQIGQQVDALEVDPSKFDTPLAISLDVEILGRSDKAEDRVLAELSLTSGSLQARFDSLTQLVVSLARSVGELPRTATPWLTGATFAPVASPSLGRPGVLTSADSVLSAYTPRPAGIQIKAEPFISEKPTT